MTPPDDLSDEVLALGVAGHTFLVRGTQAVRLLRALEGFAGFIRPGTGEDRAPLFTFEYRPGVFSQDRSSLTPLYRFETEGYDCSFCRTPQGYSFSMSRPGNRAEGFGWTFHPGERRFAARGGIDVASLRFSLWQALGTAVLPLGTAAVHASTICWQEKAVLFLGESGTGKSTHTRLWQQYVPGATLLNDDSPFLQTRPEDDQAPCVWGSPWSGKTPCYHDIRRPLAGIVRLSQATDNRIRRLSVAEAVGALLPSLPPALAYAQHTRELLLDIVCRTIERVPVFHLQCRPDAQAVRLSREAVFESSPQR